MMNTLNMKTLIIFFIFFSIISLSFAQSISPKRELRAVWIATVANIDYPSRKNLHPFEQQDEFRALIQKHRQLGINAVFVQVRPATDAFYYSDRELWSEWLSGKQGNEPRPFYDPLAYMIEEAHKNGMEFHAWFNPYRAVFDTARSSEIHPEHITNRRPEWFIQYGKTKYFNPALPQVREYITSIITDVVKRYPIDGVHFDDYFYPYPIANTPLDDQKDFERYGQDFKNIQDWRRHNVNLLIESVAKSIRQTKPKVKFGVSPFGVWRNERDEKQGSKTTTGTTSYDHLYADVRHWLKNAWIDYVVPQIYFHSQFKPAPYQQLVDWWAANGFGKHLYIGMAAYKIGSKTDTLWQNLSEMPSQLRFNRACENIKGSVFFSAKSIFNNSLHDSLKTNFYRYPALVPPMPWKDSIAANPPTDLVLHKSYKAVFLQWKVPQRAKDGDEAVYYIIYRFNHNEPINLEDASKIVGIRRQQGEFFVDKTVKHGGKYRYLVTALDQMHNESPASNVVFVDFADSSWLDFVKLLLEIYFKR
ncbi:MAG: glycoside hydrolase family 10 protein [Thermoflexibacter sp.]